jgi:nitrate reductase delta subunit
MQRHFVEVFDMKRRACPFLTYWTNGDTRNRGVAILRFKQAYAGAGFTLGSEELPDHLAVVLEFAAVGDRVTGDALLAEHAAAIGLLREALHDLRSAYSHVLDAVVATLPEITDEVAARMVELAASGPPVEDVGLEPFPTALAPIGARR